MLFLKKPPVAWLIVGLGNPGPKYEDTRHNVGWRAVDALAERAGVKVQRAKHRGLTATAQVGGQGALLLKPTTFMNSSGESVAEAARFYKLPPDRVLVISDDVDLALGKLRIRKSGSAGGHNGLKSIIQCLSSDQFPRLRIGVGGKPHPDCDMVDWVLSSFHGEDKKVMDEAVRQVAGAVEYILEYGLDRAMNQYN